MKKDFIAGLLQLLIVAALVFVGYELHRMNERLGSTMDVKVSAGGILGNGLEVTITKPVKVRPDSPLTY